MLFIIGIAEKLILLILFGLSMWSIAIIWDRKKTFKNMESAESFANATALLKKNNAAELQTWAKAKSDNMHAQTLQSALELGLTDSENIDRNVRSFLTSERTRLEKGFNVLATLGSNAPFIGLLGTVLGIIQSFGLLATDKSDTSALMKGISIALVATAAGLFVAIPAVVAYNVFTRKLKVLISECESLRDLYIAQGFNRK